MSRRESLVSFLCKHNVIEIGLKTERQRFVCCSTNYVFNVRRVWYSTPNNSIHVVSWLPYLLFFPVLSLARVRPHLTKVSLPPLYLWGFSPEKKYQAPSVCTTSISEWRSLGTRLYTLRMHAAKLWYTAASFPGSQACVNGAWERG